MATRTVRAIRRDDGYFESLEPVSLPTGTVVEFTVTEPSPRGEGSGLRASAGGWADLLDCEAFEREVYERRHRTRPATSL